MENADENAVDEKVTPAPRALAMSVAMIGFMVLAAVMWNVRSEGIPEPNVPLFFMFPYFLFWIHGMRCRTSVARWFIIAYAGPCLFSAPI